MCSGPCVRLKQREGGDTPAILPVPRVTDNGLPYLGDAGPGQFNFTFKNAVGEKDDS